MSSNNHSRNYYISNENMSDIKESIEQQYSMKFQKQSGIHGNSKSRSEIAQMISGSHQATQSRVVSKSKVNPMSQPTPINQQNIHYHEQIEEQNKNDKKSIYLGDHVYAIIRERYYQTMKIQTDDPQVLYEFYFSQRKHISKLKPIKDQDIQNQMPSMQRKLLIKKKFHTILTYYPDDVHYTLHFQAKKMKMDRQVDRAVQFLNKGRNNKKNQKVNESQIKNIVQRLYNTKGNLGLKESKLTPQENQKIRRVNFGLNLSQHFQNAYRQKGPPSNIQTVDKLFDYWSDIYDRKLYQIQWPQETAKQTIQQYMYQQVQDLMNLAAKKLGFNCEKQESLFKFYHKNCHSIQNIYIPFNSFFEYTKVYKQVQDRNKKMEQLKNKKDEIKVQQKRKKSEVKKFGRPVSATPISILSKPKTVKKDMQHLVSKYPNDKTIRTLLTQQQLKKPRYGFQYGVHDIQKQIKLKQWVKIDPKHPQQKYDQMISKKLSQTFSNPEFFKNHEDTDQVMSLLVQENLEKPEVWRQLGPVLHQAMLVKAHQQDWFRQCIINHVKKLTGQSLELQTNQVLFNKLFNYIKGLDQTDKSNQFQKLQALILNSQDKAQKQKKLSQTKMVSQQQNAKQRRLLYALLQDKAIEYVKMRIRKNNQKFTLRNYLNQLFKQCQKEHPTLVKRQFNVVQGEKQCPKLLKYHFFRLVKEVNPITLQRENVLKNHAWLPTKNSPQCFNYKSYNAFSEFYMKDRNVIIAQPQKQQFRQTIWGRNKGQDRINLMMTYSDAKQCIFQPKISKKT